MCLTQAAYFSTEELTFICFPRALSQRLYFPESIRSLHYLHLALFYSALRVALLGLYSDSAIQSHHRILSRSYT